MWKSRVDLLPYVFEQCLHLNLSGSPPPLVELCTHHGNNAVPASSQDGQANLARGRDRKPPTPKPPTQTAWPRSQGKVWRRACWRGALRACRPESYAPAAWSLFYVGGVLTATGLWIWAMVLRRSQSLHAQEAARSSSVSISKQYMRVRKRGGERDNEREREIFSEGDGAALVSRHPTPRPPPSRTHLPVQQEHRSQNNNNNRRGSTVCNRVLGIGDIAGASPFAGAVRLGALAVVAAE